MPAVGCENISCGSPLYLSNPVPPNEKPFCPNQYRARVVSWDPPSAQFTQLQSSCGGPSHYVGIRPITRKATYLLNRGACRETSSAECMYAGLCPNLGARR